MDDFDRQTSPEAHKVCSLRKPHTPKLSICIPVYNRAAQLRDLLDSIAASARLSERCDWLEIIISDNGSSDNTAEVIDDYRAQFTFFTSNIFSENRGPDANYLKVIEMARAEYVWLMGSDDAIALGSLECVFEAIDSKAADLYLIDLIKCDRELKPIANHSWFKNDGNQFYNLYSTSEKIRLFDQARPLWGLLFGYLSSIIFRRQEFQDQGYDPYYDTSLYSFLFPIMQMIANGCAFYHIADNLVLNRGNNDSMPALHENKVFHRLSMDVDWYLHFGDLMSDPVVRESWLNLGKRNFGTFYMLKFSGLSSEEEWSELSAKLLRLGFDSRYLLFVRFLKGLARACLYTIDVRQRLKTRFRQYVSERR